MGTPRVAGIETEYGILIRGAAEVDPFSASDLLLEQFARSDETVEPLGMRVGSPDLDGYMLANGARLYIDHAHPEYSTPETATPRDAVAADKAGEVLLERCQCRANASGALVVNLKGEKLRPAAEAAFGPRPIRFVVDAVGRYELINLSLPLMAEHSAYSIYGIPDHNNVSFDKALGPTHWKLDNFYMDESAVYRQMLDMVRLGFVNPRDFYDLVIPFNEVDEGLNRINRREITKFVVDMAL